MEPAHHLPLLYTTGLRTHIRDGNAPKRPVLKQVYRGWEPLQSYLIDSQALVKTKIPNLLIRERVWNQSINNPLTINMLQIGKFPTPTASTHQEAFGGPEGHALIFVNCFYIIRCKPIPEQVTNKRIRDGRGNPWPSEVQPKGLIQRC